MFERYYQRSPDASPGGAPPALDYLSYAQSLGSLIGAWMLDEASGDAIDSSTTGADGTINGSPSRNQTGVIPKAGGGTYGCMVFDNTGTDQWVSIADAAIWSVVNTGELTVVAVVRPEATSDVHCFVSKGATDNYEWDLNGGDFTLGDDFRANYRQLGSTSIATAQDGGNTFDGSTWFCIGATYDIAGTELILYKDGSSAGSDTSWSGSNAGGTAAVAIGRHGDDFWYVDGAVQGVLIFDAVLTPTEMANLATYAGV